MRRSFASIDIAALCLRNLPRNARVSLQCSNWILVKEKGQFFFFLFVIYDNYGQCMYVAYSGLLIHAHMDFSDLFVSLSSNSLFSFVFLTLVSVL